MNQKELKWFGIKKRTFYNEYGRSINVSTGLILGLFLDKLLFYLTKGLSVLIPPLSVFLITKGKVLFRIRFERKFNKFIEKFIICHLIGEQV